MGPGWSIKRGPLAFSTHLTTSTSTPTSTPHLHILGADGDGRVTTLDDCAATLAQDYAASEPHSTKPIIPLR